MVWSLRTSGTLPSMMHILILDNNKFGHRILQTCGSLTLFHIAILCIDSYFSLSSFLAWDRPLQKLAKARCRAGLFEILAAYCLEWSFTSTHFWFSVWRKCDVLHSFSKLLEECLLSALLQENIHLITAYLNFLNNIFDDLRLFFKR